MGHKFTKHYTRDEARALLPRINQWLVQLAESRSRLKELDERLRDGLRNGADLGGETVNGWIKTMFAFQEILDEFQKREIQVKDIERGLIDFPAFVGGQEVFLCWEKDEEDIEFWHNLSTGFADRVRL